MSSLIQELVAENQMLRKQLDALSSSQQLPKQVAAPDAFELDTIELLKAEVERLQNELTDREMTAQSEYVPENSADLGIDSAADGTQLLARLDELLGELGQSDQRIAILEELLHASEEATAAEREERRQLEAWVEDIERRVSDRETDWKAETDMLRMRLAEATEQRAKIDQSLKAAVCRSGKDERVQAEMKSWQTRASELQQQLADADRERLTLSQKLRELEQQATGCEQVAQLEQELRQERVRIAQERAEIARERADVMTLRAQIDHTAAGDSSALEVENRMRAFRQHLREIHAEEQSAPQPQRGLSARIAQLWKRLDDRF